LTDFHENVAKLNPPKPSKSIAQVEASGVKVINCQLMGAL
jgi:hypothetical protein